MPPPASHQRSDAIYHVASRGNRRKPIFIVDEDSALGSEGCVGTGPNMLESCRFENVVGEALTPSGVVSNMAIP